jgi:hypothetical protein
MDRFPENKVNYRIYPDTQVFSGRKNGKPNLSSEANSLFGQTVFGILPHMI